MKRLRIEHSVTVRAPTRIDLAGGTVDIWPLHLFHPGAVTLNAAVGLPVEVRLRPWQASRVRIADRNARRSETFASWEEVPRRGRHALFGEALRHYRPDRGFDVDFSFEAPRGAGLAGSSALLTAFCGALIHSAGGRIRREVFVRTVRDIETRLIGVPAGMQDYYPAVWGGVQALWWGAGGVWREPLPGVASELEKRLVLVYTGRSRHSGTNNWEVFKRHLDGDRAVRRGLDRVTRAARELCEALKERAFERTGEAMAEEAAARARLFPGIVTPEIVRLGRSLRRAGAQAVKVCGAGGGGCVVAYAEPCRREAVQAAAAGDGRTMLAVRLVRRGLELHRS